jgi:hypothetical protein
MGHLRFGADHRPKRRGPSSPAGGRRRLYLLAAAFVALLLGTGLGMYLAPALV